ncbi:MAG TPA: PQQ-binding-like beta-propeller repeat protein [Polyangia bacterium]|nr:PQQ-binding-like beta-propeller repeat protein [Polyangia bacterium]
MFTKISTVTVMVTVLAASSAARAEERFSPTWTYKAHSGGKVLAAPVSVEGAVITTSTGGDVASVRLADGAERWSRVLTGDIGATPIVSKGRIAISTLAGQLYGLDLATGAVRWRQAFGGGMNYASPALADSRSIVLPEGFPAQIVHRIDLATGKRMWSTRPSDIAGLMYTTPAIDGARAIVGMNGGRYQALDLATGETRWKYDVAGQVFMSSALVDGGTVFMFPGDDRGQLFAVDAATGVPVAGFPVAIPDAFAAESGGKFGNGPAVSTPTKAGDLIVVQLRRQNLLNPPGRPAAVAMREIVAAVDPRTAKVVWQVALASVTVENSNGVPELNACATPVSFSSDGEAMIAVSSSIEPRVAVLDATTGAQRWTAALSSPGRSSPVFSNGLLLVGTDAGVLHAFSSTGKKSPRSTNLVAAAEPSRAPASTAATIPAMVRPPIGWSGGEMSSAIMAAVINPPETALGLARSAANTTVSRSVSRMIRAGHGTSPLALAVASGCSVSGGRAAGAGSLAALGLGVVVLVRRARRRRR